MRCKGPVLLFVLTGMLSATPVIPVEDDVALIMQLHADSKLDYIAATILDESGLIDSGAMFHYTGEFTANYLGNDMYSGSWSGQLTGTYFGDVYTLLSIGSFVGDDVTFNLTSSGKWGTSIFLPKDLRGKDFTDKGTLIEKADALSGTVTVTTAGVDKTIDIPEIKKKKSGTKSTASGTVEVPSDGEKKSETVELVVDSTAGTVTSKLSSAILILDNQGKVVVADLPDGGKRGMLSFDLSVTQVPEPSTAALVLAAGAVLLFRRKRASRTCRSLRHLQHRGPESLL